MDTINILLIDDDVNLYNYYSGLFKIHFGESISLHHCISKKQLSNDNNQYDIIILDQRLKDGEKGISLMPMIRDKYQFAKVIMNSAFGNERLAIKAFKSGVDDYVEGHKDDDEALITIIKESLSDVDLRRQVESMTRDLIEGNYPESKRCEELAERINKRIEKLNWQR